ncbi:MAG: SDR family oxidoreductase [Bacteroidetes bacterium]|nr:SDR family oxidoreductase [Bacteroidota bacterium]
MNIIITGASKGIGAEVAKTFCKHKGNQVIALSRNAEGLRRVSAECQKNNAGSKIMTVEFDLTQFDFYPFILQKIETYFHRCDILINNAGRLVNKPFDKIEIQDFDDVFNVNIKSLFFFTKLILPMMNKGGHILNISSLGGIPGSKKFSGLSAYSASKGAVSVFTEALAEELKESEISVNCLALGGVQTEMFEKAFPGYKALQTSSQMAQFITDFAVTGQRFFNGKVIPVSTSLA